MRNKGRLIIFSAPSGCGKGTMLAEITKDSSFRCSVSATTRAPREGEIPDVSYHYITREEFERRIGEDAFLEHAEYCGNCYGTLHTEVDEWLEKGVNVILEIEVQGAMEVMKKCPDALSIFVTPPSMKELERRLRKRGTEPDDVIAQRLAKAADEIAQAPKYQYVIVNDALEDAIRDFFTVVDAEKFSGAFSQELINEVLKNA